MLYRSWNKATEKLSSHHNVAYKHWRLVYGVDSDYEFAHKLSRTERQSFHMSLIAAKDVYRVGDIQYGILLKADVDEAYVMWHRAEGNMHYAHIAKNDGYRSLGEAFEID